MDATIRNSSLAVTTTESTVQMAVVCTVARTMASTAVVREVVEDQVRSEWFNTSTPSNSNPRFKDQALVTVSDRDPAPVPATASEVVPPPR